MAEQDRKVVGKIGRQPNTIVGPLMYRTLIVIFDALDDILSWARRPFDKKPDDRPVESDQWDDAEILRRYDDPEGMSPMADSVGKIGDHTLVKVTFEWNTRYLEASSFEFVRTHTTIPIPRIRRTFIDENGGTINVMDYIPGKRLDHVWPSLSLWTKLWVGLTLRRYIRQLRQIKDSHSSVPGPVADSPQRWIITCSTSHVDPFPITRLCRRFTTASLT
ncbi:hypothetical protein DFH94DRAFT_207925 [Russula ochroleuca]|uniref:Uncharacterized protein n=1 Tax=Russula ochroleuca TaxID=152965 RepID=A0A9P5JZM7_9AGAM|nr:hypothetical protein DFH94DRAFT_207925 [Russula ochroleuca]